MITFDIEDLCVNVHINETLNIIKAKLFENNNIQITQQILSLLKVNLSQNYFTFPTRTRHLHGVSDMKLNSRNIFTTL
jgi:hypothetical protein